MSAVRILVGTRKGAFVLPGKGERERCAALLPENPGIDNAVSFAKLNDWSAERESGAS